MKMKKFKHDNVMTLIGVCIDSDGSPMVVLPYMDNGDLLSYMRKHNPDMAKLLKFALDIAKGGIIPVR